MIWCLWAMAGPIDESATAFENGDLDAARQMLEARVESGWASGRVKFNLGNVHYRRNDLPRAIAYWRAAGLLLPRTGAVQHNLALARSEVKRVPTPASTPALWMQIFTPGELGLIGVFFAFLGTAGLFWRKRRNNPRLPYLLTWMLGALLVGVATWGGWVVGTGPLGVVVDREAPMREAPMLEAPSRTSLQPGAELAIIGREGGFLRVETGDGDRGWVADGAVLRVPR